MEAGWRALDISLRAIDAYKKTLLVDKVTSDDETSAPVYILDEISNVLMSCSLELTKEIVEYTLRRLRHRSPQVKKKVLRFIKYTVNKAGSSAYKRELQSSSITIRELVNYQGQIDPLKGNGLNEAIRDAAQEAIKAIFSSDVRAKGQNIRIEGFGNGGFDKPSTTSYRNSSFNEMESDGFYYRNGSGSFEYHDKHGSFDSMLYKQEDVEREGFHRNGADSFDSLDCKQDRAMWNGELPRQRPGRNVCTQSKKVASPEDRLLNNITAPVGSRLRPTQESLECFLSSAKTLDAVRISGALKAKLQSSSWQVLVANEGDIDGCLRECLKSPETTLRKEAKEALKMFSILNVSVNDPVNNLSCDKPLFKTEADKEAHTRARSFKAPPAARSQHEVVDLLSFQVEDLTCNQGADTSANSVVGDPFDGMCIYASNGVPAVYAKDLLSDGWVSAHTDVPFKNWPSVQNAALSTMPQQRQYADVPFKNWPSVQNAALSTMPQQRQYKSDVLGFDSLFNLTANMSNSTGQCAASSLDSKTSQALSKESMLRNLDALYMQSNGPMGSLHTNTWL